MTCQRPRKQYYICPGEHEFHLFLFYTMQPRLTVKLAITYPIELYMMIQNWELLLTHVHEVVLPSQPNLMLMSQFAEKLIRFVQN